MRAVRLAASKLRATCCQAELVGVEAFVMTRGTVSTTCDCKLVSRRLAEREPGPPAPNPPESQNWTPTDGTLVLVRSFHSTNGPALVMLAGLIHPSIVNPERLPRSR